MDYKCIKWDQIPTDKTDIGSKCTICMDIALSDLPGLDEEMISQYECIDKK